MRKGKEKGGTWPPERITLMNTATIPHQGFVFKRVYRDAARELTDAERLAVYDAVIDYALDGRDLAGLAGGARAVARLMCGSIDDSRGTRLPASNDRKAFVIMRPIDKDEGPTL